MGWTMRHSSERQTLCCASERDLVVVPLLNGDHYSTLSVPFTASDGQIQAAFRKLVPTGHRTQMQASYLNSVIAAYTVLSDPLLRKKIRQKAAIRSRRALSAHVFRISGAGEDHCNSKVQALPTL